MPEGRAMLDNCSMATLATIRMKGMVNDEQHNTLPWQTLKMSIFECPQQISITLQLSTD